jgi:hypothetical protein
MLIPVVWPFVAKSIWNATITIGEMALQIGIACILVMIMWGIGASGQTTDYELWSGQIVGKAQQRVSCEHSYDCNCRKVKSCTTSGTGKNKTKSCSTSTVCDTCYEHSHDYDWNVDTNIPGGDFRVGRVDRRGTQEPPRWSAVELGEPAATFKSYTNWIKGAPRSLFNATVNPEQFKGMIPPYPKVYDYHKVNRIIQVGVNVPDVAKWNRELANHQRELGPNKQMNSIIVVVNTDDRMYRYALENAWMGGKKNDAVLIIGTTDGGKTLSWVEVMSWSKNELFNVVLHDEVMDIGTLDMGRIVQTFVATADKEFVRRPMKEFEYLSKERKPPEWAQWTIVVIGALVSAGLTIWFHRVEVIGPMRRRNRRRKV